jgi:hypothetical protein
MQNPANDAQLPINHRSVAFDTAQIFSNNMFIVLTTEQMGIGADIMA